ncbi:MAG TPA: ABC transporter permease [Phycisphaerae bacterium]|nr:ABC transporter permease [Phycisphaerae bacterium]
MGSLALAHLFHRKLRTSLSVLAVAIGITMLLVMLGLSHGMLNEVAERVQSVDAELIVLPENENVIFTAGTAFTSRIVPIIDSFEFGGRRVVKRTISVMLDTLHMGGQQQRLFGVDRTDMPAFLGSRKVVEGRLFDDGRAFGNHLDSLRNPNGYYDPSQISEDELRAACELVIDTRLARVGSYRVGEQVVFLGRPFKIVGIVESGVAGRVFCPLQVLQLIKNGGVPWVSLFFVQLQPPPAEQRTMGGDRQGEGVSQRIGAAGYEEAVADAMSKKIKAKVEPKSSYRNSLYESFSQVYLYINAASTVALIVCFLIILQSMYAMVLERTREIGILKSLGAGRLYLIAESVTEAVMVCVTGTALGIGLAFATKYILEAAKPLLTITLEARFVGLALVIGIIGGTLSALYPGYRAARLDPVAALTFE